ncbi:MAG: hypothetical protein WBH04_00990 [Albidovulum sp.]
MTITRKTFTLPAIITLAAALQFTAPAIAEAAVTSRVTDEETSRGICHLIDFDEPVSVSNGISKQLLRQMRRSDNFDELLSYSLDHCPEVAAILLSGATGSLADNGDTKARDDKERRTQNDKPADEKPSTDKPGDEEPETDKPGDEEPETDKPGDEEPGDEEPGNNKPGDEEVDY